jgi:hypothetical protein
MPRTRRPRPQAFDPAEDLGERGARHRYLGELEHHVAAVAHDPGADQDKLPAWGCEPPILGRLAANQFGFGVTTSLSRPARGASGLRPTASKQVPSVRPRLARWTTVPRRSTRAPASASSRCTVSDSCPMNVAQPAPQDARRVRRSLGAGRGRSCPYPARGCEEAGSEWRPHLHRGAVLRRALV